MSAAPWAEWVEQQLEAAPPLSESTARRLSAALFGTGSSEAA